MHFQWIQLVHSIPKKWIDNIKNNRDLNFVNLTVRDHNICTSNRICTLNKLTAKEIYKIIISFQVHKPTSQQYFRNLFTDTTFN